jgi:hypothetical protein
MEVAHFFGLPLHARRTLGCPIADLAIPNINFIDIDVYHTTLAHVGKKSSDVDDEDSCQSLWIQL